MVPCPPIALAVVGLVITCSGLIALGTGVAAGQDFAGSIEDTIVALHVLEGVMALFLGVCGAVAVFMGVAPKITGLVATITGAIMLLFAWMSAGSLALLSSADFIILDSTGKAALAFDIITGALGLIWMVLSIKVSNLGEEESTQ